MCARQDWNQYPATGHTAKIAWTRPNTSRPGRAVQPGTCDVRRQSDTFFLCQHCTAVPELVVESRCSYRRSCEYGPAYLSFASVTPCQPGLSMMPTRSIGSCATSRPRRPRPHRIQLRRRKAPGLVPQPARPATPRERDEILAKGVEFYPGWTKYEARAGERYIEAFVLSRK